MTMSDDKFRLMDTIVRVRDLGASLDFYTRLLGMKLLRKMNFPEGKFTLAFVGYGPEDTHAALELTHNWDQAKPYDLGTGCGHIAPWRPGHLRHLQGTRAGWRKDPAAARPDEARDDAYRLGRSRGPQDRAH